MYICSRKFARHVRVSFGSKIKHCKMKKEIRQDIYTQSEYAKLKGITRARVNQLVKAGELRTLTVKGATLIKV